MTIQEFYTLFNAHIDTDNLSDPWYFHIDNDNYHCFADKDELQFYGFKNKKFIHYNELEPIINDFHTLINETHAAFPYTIIHTITHVLKPSEYLSRIDLLFIYKVISITDKS